MLLPLQLQQPHGIKFLERPSYVVGHIRQKLGEHQGARRADLSKQTKGCCLLTGSGIGVSDVLPMLTVEGAYGMPIARESGSLLSCDGGDGSPSRVGQALQGPAVELKVVLVKKVLPTKLLPFSMLEMITSQNPCFPSTDFVPTMHFCMTHGADSESVLVVFYSVPWFTTGRKTFVIEGFLNGSMDPSASGLALERQRGGTERRTRCWKHSFH
jgi:hypothetical protein